MKRFRYGLLPALLLAGGVACAQEAIVGASPKSRASLDLYASADAAQAVKQLAVGEAGFPLPVLETENSRSHVRVGGEDFWVKNAHVQFAIKVSKICPPKALQPTPTINSSTPAASENGCK